jgi:hypothetical protein
MDMMHQVVITRTQDGGFRVLEMNAGGTQREHDLKPGISADMAARYLREVLNDLVAVPKQ